MRAHGPYPGRWIAPALVASALGMAACDQELPMLYDASDVTVEILADTTSEVAIDPLADTAFEVVADTVADDGSSTCTYPTGPYAFSAVGNTVGPMTWPSALAGIDESLPASLEALHCDPGVKSIFVQIAAIS